jgi:aspartate aminotransferase-like enzyme
VGSVTSSKGRYHHIVDTDASVGTYDIGVKEVAEDVYFNKKQKAIFGMPASEMRLSIKEEMPFNMGKNIFEDEEEVPDTAETKEN